jgi:hypothetical protein
MNGFGFVDDDVYLLSLMFIITYNQPITVPDNQPSVSFETWVNPLSWILTPRIVVEINSYRFLYNDNISPKNGIGVTSLKFKNFSTHAEGEIVGCWVQRFPLVSRHGLTYSFAAEQLEIFF